MDAILGELNELEIQFNREITTKLPTARKIFTQSIQILPGSKSASRKSGNPRAKNCNFLFAVLYRLESVEDSFLSTDRCSKDSLKIFGQC